jgi:hypothetical protein
MPKKRVSKKRSVHKVSKKAPRRTVSKKTRTSKPVVRSRVGLVLKNLIVFLALALVSFISSFILVSEVLKRLLIFLALVFVFLSVAFLIVLLVLLILRSIKTKKK